MTDSFGKQPYLRGAGSAEGADVARLDRCTELQLLLGTPLGANHALTDALYAHGSYNGGETGYTRNETNAGETFHLKAFLGDPRCPWGQCNDFADFLACLSTSVGASEMTAQRTNSFEAPGFWYNWLRPAGDSTWYHGTWNYHQFGVVSSSTWDGCIYLYGFGVPKNWDRDTTYRVRFVKEWLTGRTWSPTPSGGFVPALATATPN